MEHHVLERPKIIAERRKPSVVKFEVDNSDAATFELRYSKRELAKEKIIPRSPINYHQSENGSRNSQLAPPTTKPRVVSQRNFVGLPLVESNKKTPEEENLDTKQSSSSLGLAPKVPPRPDGGLATMRMTQQQQRGVKPELRKWVRVLGFPMNWDETWIERKRVEEIAKQRGADVAQIKFMLDQILPVDQMEHLLNEQKFDVKALQGRLLLGVVRTVDNDTMQSLNLS